VSKLSINPVKKAEIERQNAVTRVEADFADAIAAGFETSEGWRLGLTPDDVTLLTGNFVLAKEAAGLGAPIPPVIDMDGEVHSLTIEELTSLMLAYGQHRAAISARYASELKATHQGGP
jgi:hypothetical protein